MKISFAKTDRLIELIEDSKLVLSLFNYKEAYELKNSNNPTLNELYNELVYITLSDKSIDEKQIERYRAYAKSFGKDEDIEAGRMLLETSFDEKKTLERLTRAYWQIQSFITIQNDNNSDSTDIATLTKFLSNRYPNEPCKDVINDVLRKKEPRIKDIEAEFWGNCPDASSINDFLNIYRERWTDCLEEIDEDFYNLSTILFDESNELHCYLKELRLCGLLKAKETHIEAKLQNIAISINMVCNDVVRLFTSIRASILPTISDNGILNDSSDDSFTNKMSMKVTTDAMVILLKKAGITENTHEKTKIAELISLITGFSYNTTRQRITNPDCLTDKTHGDQVNKFNKLFFELGINTTINCKK